MADNSEAVKIAEPSSGKKKRDEASYWRRVVKRYEKRNASLERVRDALVERVHFMECALPSLLMGAAVANTKRTFPEPAKLQSQKSDLER